MFKFQKSKIDYLSAMKQDDIGGIRKPWPSGKPKGIVVHYTAGGSLLPTIETLKKKRLAYHYLIDRDGFIQQCAAVDSATAHAGKSHWEGFNPNNEFIGVALCNYGKLTLLPNGEYQNAYGGRVGDVAEGGGGYWELCPMEQINAFEQVISYLVEQHKIDPKLICGHSECSPRRKIDPGYILTYAISELRDALISGESIPLG